MALAVIWRFVLDCVCLCLPTLAYTTKGDRNKNGYCDAFRRRDLDVLAGWERQRSVDSFKGKADKRGGLFHQPTKKVLKKVTKMKQKSIIPGYGDSVKQDNDVIIDIKPKQLLEAPAKASGLQKKNNNTDQRNVVLMRVT